MKHISLIFSILFMTIFSFSAQDCNDYTETSGTDNEPGIYGVFDYTINYSGNNQVVELGVYGFFSGWDSSSQADQTFFSVNGSDPIALSDLSYFCTYLEGVCISLNTMSLNDEYLPNATSTWTSGTVKFTGAIENITMTQFESGLLFSCVQELETIEGCDYQFEGDDPGFDGYIITNDYPFSFSGENQQVRIGYFDYVAWEDQGLQGVDDSFFSVNGSELFNLGTIFNNQPFSIGDVTVTVDTTSIPEGYNVPEGMYSGTIIFEGEINLIHTYQVESGIKFICVEEIEGEEDCIDYTEDNGTPEFPGIYGGSDATVPFDGSYQTITMGIYGLFNDWALSGQQDETFFAINNGPPVSLKFLQENSPLVHQGIFIDMDLNSLNDEYLSESSFDWTSATISFTGAIDEVIMTQFESGLLFACTVPDFLDECVDYTEWNTDLSLPGLWLLFGNYTLNYDSTFQEVSMGIYGSFLDWDMDSIGNNAPFAGFVVNGEYVNMETIVLNSPFTFNDIVIEIDTNDLSGEFPMDDSFTPWTSGTITFTGYVSEITLGLMEWGMLYSCTMPLEEEEQDCIDYTEENDDPFSPGIYLGVGDFVINFDSTHQEVSLGIYGGFLDWVDIDDLGQADQTFFSVNGSDAVSLETIYLNLPFEINDVIINLDTNNLAGDYSIADYWTSGTISFNGYISEIIMTQFESGMLFSCSVPSEVQADCIDYTETNDDPNSPGIYLIDDDFSMVFDSTHQEVSLGIYGFFDWSNIGSQQADQTFFSVNGSEAISLEEIYLTQPYILDGIEITVDTTALNDDYPLADYWPSGTIMFTGHISEVVMTQFESGLLFSCVNSAEEECECEECACQIDADFNYVNISNYYSFVSSGTGTEYEWHFGDGVTSTDENPTHQYASPGGYEVCLTNFNLTDTCSITICKSILFMANTPEAHIITPNGDGYDDEVKIYCNNVTVYNRNGIVVTEILNQEYWDGTDGMSIILPMGEYILKCNENEVIQKITIIR